MATLGDWRITVFAEPDPAAVPWGEVGADVVIESTGRCTNRDAAAAHLTGDVATFVLGVNDGTLDPDGDDIFSIFSNGSCTTNSLAPLAKVLHDSFGIESGLMPTVHACTGDQRLHDAPHSDLHRARAAALSTIPTSSGAARAIGAIIPELDAPLTEAAGRQVKVFGWYDNEWGFSHRLVELSARIGAGVR